MVRTIITPKKNHVSINLPKEYIGKKVEVIAFTIDDDNKKDFHDDSVFTHFASEKVLSKAWLEPEEDNAWKNL
ncbi:MAG: hypothetical protein SFY32_04320 [Bacteroidota bacterium]|nr:hypothetical protein [Bacteroidota bacterium]